MNYTEYRSEVINDLRRLTLPGEVFEDKKMLVRHFRMFSSWRIDNLAADYWKAEKPIAECVGMCFWYISKDDEINQCDGCRRGLPVVDDLHIDPETGHAYMGCEKKRYKEKDK